MVPIDEARAVVVEWNKTQPAGMFVAFETVEEAILLFNQWRVAIWTRLQPAIVADYLLRHNEHCKRIPDSLLLLLSEEEDDKR